MKHKTKFCLNSGNIFHFGSRRRLLSSTSVRYANVVLKTVNLETGNWLPFDMISRSAAEVAEIAAGATRRSRLQQLMSSTIPDGGLPLTFFGYSRFHDQLHLSMNKRKRWLLPELITDCIEGLRSDELSSLMDNGADVKALYAMSAQRNSADIARIRNRIPITN